MTRKKRKFNFLHLLIVLLIVAVFIAGGFFGAKYLMNKFHEATKKETPSQDKSNEPINTNEEVKIEIVDYVTYEDSENELGFDFLLADLKFTCVKDLIHYDLNSLETEEHIKLGSILEYEEKIESIGIQLSKLNYTKEVKSNMANSITCRVLIPVTDTKKSELKVYNGERLTFDLLKSLKTVESLKPYNENKETIIASNNFNIGIYDSYISDIVMSSGERFKKPSTWDVYTFEIQVNEMNVNGLYVESAIFVPSGTSTSYNAENEIYSESVENIVGKALKKDDRYALFFIISSGNNMNSLDGKLFIEFSNGERIELNTNK